MVMGVRRTGRATFAGRVAPSVPLAAAAAADTAKPIMLRARQDGSDRRGRSAGELVDEVRVVEFAVVEHHVRVGVGRHRAIAV